MSPAVRRLGAAIAFGLVVLINGCTMRPGSPGGAAPAGGQAKLTVLMINGGGNSAGNFQSHLLHVKQLLEVLEHAGVPSDRVTILSADGSDPAKDLALREVQPEPDFWLLSGTRLEKALRTPIVYDNSTVPGVELRPATRVEVERWFKKTGSRLRSGDTLLIYVTDHGNRNPQDVSNNRITLWGQGEVLSVNELRTHVASLDPGVRVVTVMSQCFSGSFANLINDAQGRSTARVCGFFSTTAERPAYGCYPENFGRENVGHSFHFIHALGTTGHFADAHAEVLRADATPDVPLRTSDFYLEQLLRRAATAQGQDYNAFVDSLLARAWQDKARWEPEIRQLDAIGHAFGSFSPRSLAELDEQAKRLPDVSTQLSTHGKAWKAALSDANRNNVDRFLAAKPSWAEALKEDAVKNASTGGARDFAAPMVAELGSFTRADVPTETRLVKLRDKSDTASAAAYRMEVRLGAVLRMRTLLTSIAGRVYLAEKGTPGERDLYESLRRCEDLELPLKDAAPATLAEPTPFPPLEEDMQLAKEVLPAWMGIQFKEANEKIRTEHHLSPGASTVMVVYPDSPAKVAGVQVGDVILGPPGAPFRDKNQIREWTMLAAVDQPRPLDVLRGDSNVRVTLVPKPYPMKWPELPGPPKVSSAAPLLKPLELAAYRGDLPRELKGSGSHMLFFWATWCGPCKASLPELVAFESARNTPVIAITDEQPEKLDSFFKTFSGPFPNRVAVDEFRRSFLAYGVSGTPTFVLVDDTGTIRAYSTGYSAKKGLGIEGWTWAAAGGAPASQ